METVITPGMIWIIGQGHVGTALAALLSARKVPCRASRRRAPDPALVISGAEAFRLDTADAHLRGLNPSDLRETCLPGLSASDRVLFTFSLAKPDGSIDAVALQLCEEVLGRGANLILLSSTSCYVKDEGEVTEADERRVALGRFQAEESLRLKGAMLVPLAGLFGGDRDPCSWLARGLIKNGQSGVNLIHHDDVAVCLAEILTDPRAEEVVNVSSGQSVGWDEICLGCQKRGRLSPDFKSGAAGGSAPRRVISNEKLLGLYPRLRHHQFQSLF